MQDIYALLADDNVQQANRKLVVKMICGGFKEGKPIDLAQKEIVMYLLDKASVKISEDERARERRQRGAFTGNDHGMSLILEAYQLEIGLSTPADIAEIQIGLSKGYERAKSVVRNIFKAIMSPPLYYSGPYEELCLRIDHLCTYILESLFIMGRVDEPV